MITKVKFEAAIRRWFRHQIAETEAGRGRVLWDVNRLTWQRHLVLKHIDSELETVRSLWEKAKGAYMFDENDVDKIVDLYLGDNADELRYWATEMNHPVT